MRCASWVVALALAAVPGASADDEPHAQPTSTATSTSPDPRGALAQQLADESAIVDRTLATVTDMLAAIDGERTQRLAAAYRVLHASRAAVATRDLPMTTARRRAAARLLVERDLAERQLLADELSQLRAAESRIAGDRARVPSVELPTELQRPAKGNVARKFGTLQHDRSKAVLSRRGIDIEVEARAPVLATADGTVRYAGPIRGLDRGVIIDHGGFFTVIAKLGEIAVPMGVPVKRGDPIGRAARHRVYLEVRVKIGPSGLPIDPEPLISSRR